MSQKYSFYNDPSIKLIDPADWDDKNSIKEEIKQLFIENTGISPEKLDITQNLSSEERGDYSCSVAMALANEKHSNPVEIANDIVNKLGRNDLVQKFEVIKPGFINIYINKEKFVKRFTNFDKQEMFKPLKGKRIMVEFAHPNPFKAFHIGHLRNIILGESIVRLLENSGAEVIRTNYQGDVGMHIAKCLWSFKKIPQSDYPSEITKRVELIAKCYTEGAKAFEDPVYQEEIMEINTNPSDIYEIFKDAVVVLRKDFPPKHSTDCKFGKWLSSAKEFNI